MTDFTNFVRAFTEAGFDFEVEVNEATNTQWVDDHSHEVLFEFVDGHLVGATNTHHDW